MTTLQLTFAAGVAAGMAAIAWFALFVVSRTLKIEGAQGLWRTAKQSAFGLGRAMDRGQLAYCCHRVSGMAIFAFLCLHVLDVGVISISHKTYDQIQAIYSTAPMRIVESLLLLAILFHALNGLRLITMELATLSTRTADRLLFWVFVLTVLLGLPGAGVILAPVLP